MNSLLHYLIYSMELNTQYSIWQKQNILISPGTWRVHLLSNVGPGVAGGGIWPNKTILVSSSQLHSDSPEHQLTCQKIFPVIIISNYSREDRLARMHENLDLTDLRESSAGNIKINKSSNHSGHWFCSRKTQINNLGQ